MHIFRTHAHDHSHDHASARAHAHADVDIDGGGVMEFGSDVDVVLHDDAHVHCDVCVGPASEWTQLASSFNLRPLSNHISAIAQNHNRIVFALVSHLLGFRRSCRSARRHECGHAKKVLVT